MKRTIGSLFASLSPAALASAQAAEQGKPAPKPDAAALKEYVGRYELDPKVVQNFIVDVTLEDGDLWVKPSHQEKHRLVARGREEFADEQFDNIRIKFNRDVKGVVSGATLTKAGAAVEAKKLILPPPSVKGDTTFRLKGRADARVVALAGSFNNWNQSQTLFAREGDGWVCRVDLLPGRYTYKFVVDGIWMTDPVNPLDEDDGNGNINFRAGREATVAQCSRRSTPNGRAERGAAGSCPAALSEQAAHRAPRGFGSHAINAMRRERVNMLRERVLGRPFRQPRERQRDLVCDQPHGGAEWDAGACRGRRRKLGRQPIYAARHEAESVVDGGAR
jgi:hypothetical protein